MTQGRIPLWLKVAWTAWLLAWAVARLGYDRRALPLNVDKYQARTLTRRRSAQILGPARRNVLPVSSECHRHSSDGCRLGR